MPYWRRQFANLYTSLGFTEENKRWDWDPLVDSKRAPLSTAAAPKEEPRPAPGKVGPSSRREVNEDDESGNAVLDEADDN